jgi:uncharacterized damage-inducible protein DinB
MPEEFEFRDLSEASFWGIDLQRATFRDVDLSGARISHARLVDVSIDAEIDRLVVNGVDVTDFVNAHDPWFTLRSQGRPADVDAMRRAWHDHRTAWEAAVARAEQLPDDQRHASVDGEWSFVQTLRHLVFATDKWWTVPVTGGAFHRLGLPNTGSRDFGWPGLELAAEPTFDEALAAWRDRAELVARTVDGLADAALDDEADVMENGPHAIRDCLGVVLEEHFQHLRYALRDLDRLA